MKTNDKGAGAYAAGAFVFLAWNVFSASAQSRCSCSVRVFPNDKSVTFI
jgi:hypothetical protein